jgi:hypothetical protein
MGGHQSYQSSTQTVSDISTSIQKTTQKCVNTTSGLNIIDEHGNHNVIDGDTQSISYSIDAACSNNIFQKENYQVNLQDTMSQQLKDQELALTQWMDGSKDTNKTNINETLGTNIKSSTVETCLNSISGKNIQNYSGDNNVMKNIKQEDIASIVGGCALKQSQSTKAVSDITNTVNQHNDYKSKNPLAFITDAITALGKSLIEVIAVIFILVVCFVGLFLLQNGKDVAPIVMSAINARAGMITKPQPQVKV